MNINYKVLLLLSILSSQALSATQAINLNDFFSDPSVTVASGGESATLAEDQNISSVLLSNDPFFGGTGITVTPDLVGISFDYTFSKPQGNSDNFFAWVFDADTFSSIDQITPPPNSGSMSSGRVFFDLSSLASNVTILGLEFQLNSLSSDRDFTSVVDISNVHLNLSSPIPLPKTLPFFLAGLCIIAYRSKINQYSFSNLLD